MSNLPLGAEFDLNAPYNERENPEVEIGVDVWLTIHKTFKVKTTDYDITYEGVDEDGNYECDRDFSGTDVWSSIEYNLPEGWEEVDGEYSIFE